MHRSLLVTLPITMLLCKYLSREDRQIVRHFLKDSFATGGFMKVHFFGSGRAISVRKKPSG